MSSNKTIFFSFHTTPIFLIIYSTVVATSFGKQTQKDNADSGVAFITPAGPSRAESPLSQGPRMTLTFVKTLYILSVLLKPTSPNSLNVTWKVLKGDTIRLRPWFIIRRVSWVYIVAYTNGRCKDYKDDWLQRGLLHSFWRQEILAWNLVFISPGGHFGRRYVSPMATRHIVQSSLKVRDGVSFFFKMESAQPVPFLPHYLTLSSISTKYTNLEGLF